jgi:hypothetical protein
MIYLIFLVLSLGGAPSGSHSEFAMKVEVSKAHFMRSNQIDNVSWGGRMAGIDCIVQCPSLFLSGFSVIQYLPWHISAAPRTLISYYHRLVRQNDHIYQDQR